MEDEKIDRLANFILPLDDEVEELAIFFPRKSFR